MSQTSRQVMSGLATVKRDFSSNTDKKEPEPSSSRTTGKRMDSSALMKAIMEGCASRDANGGSTSMASASLLSQKRPSQAAVPPAKRRTLPDSFQSSSYRTTTTSTKPPSSSYSSQRSSALSSSSAANSSQTSSGPSTSSSSSRPPPLVVSAAQSSKAAVKPATIFLSSEQKQILQLVKDGKSIFYTGSAGVFLSDLTSLVAPSLGFRCPFVAHIYDFSWTCGSLCGRYGRNITRRSIYARCVQASQLTACHWFLTIAVLYFNWHATCNRTSADHNFVQALVNQYFCERSSKPCIRNMRNPLKL